MKTKSKIGSVPLLLIGVAVLLAGGSTPSRAQNASDRFDPIANGPVLAIVIQPDGKSLIGGAFTTLSPDGGASMSRNRVARLNPDGTVDPTFDPDADGIVSAIALQPDGKIIIGGFFTTLASSGGTPITRNRVARLNADGTIDMAFDPNADAAVQSIALQTDGKILIGGSFTTLSSNGGAAVVRSRLARLDATTGAPDVFDASANGVVFAIAVEADGNILAGGSFTSIGGQARNRMARLDPTTGLADPVFDPNANRPVLTICVQPDGNILVGGIFSGAHSIGGHNRNFIARLKPNNGSADLFDPGANATVRSIALQPDGKIVAAGEFTAIGGPSRKYIARLNATNGSADSFFPQPDHPVLAIALQADGKILAGGLFTSVISSAYSGPVARGFIARLETDGRLDQTLDLGMTGTYVLTTAVQADGKIIIGGLFSSVLGVPRNNIARLNTDLSLDMQFNPNADKRVYAIAAQPDGKILVGGDFTTIGGKLRAHIARLDGTSGSADTFNPSTDLSVATIAVQPDGKVLIGGLFTHVGGQPRNYMARLNGNNGSIDSSFNPQPDDTIVCIALQRDGNILVSGRFTHIGGQPRNCIGRVNPGNGSADSFDPNADGYVLTMAVQADGRIIAGGGFSTIGGQPRSCLARLDPTLGIADAFAPNADGLVFSVAQQSDGKILAAGLFGFIGGQPRSSIARIDPATGAADSFDPSADNLVYSIALGSDGKVFAGGPFANIGGKPRNLFARLSNDTAALQNLAVTSGTITWTRDGSSPQLSRVVFEYSTNNSNYSALGDGTASGNNWSLTGLNLPATQTYYIRARGYYRSGYQTGSENPTESVRVVN
jgi:uncharacterized delta-60 repeat protein